MNITLTDTGLHLTFAPLTLTRPVGDLRMGIFTNTERWKLLSNATIFYDTETYLQKKFPSTQQNDFIIHAGLIPNIYIANKILNLPKNTQLTWNNITLATHGNPIFEQQLTEQRPLIITQRWHLYQYNHIAIASDFELITKGRKGEHLPSSNILIGDPTQIFIEQGASVEASILNTKDGPIYIGKNAQIMEGSLVKGSLALCESGVLKMGTKLYGASTIGTACKVGGELNNVIFQSNSNKAHDGFLGNSLIGEWCNLGADTNCSNLKNNYANVSTYNYQENKEIETDMQFMGLSMGDHSKCGINTMWNTASVVGVSCNIFGADFPNKFIPSFSWGGKTTVDFHFEKAVEYANNMMKRRNVKLSHEEFDILKHIHNMSLQG